MLRPRTEEEVTQIYQALVIECLRLAEQAELNQTQLADLLGASRLTIAKWQQCQGDWGTLPVSGRSASRIFLNLFVARKLLQTALSNGELPKESRPSADRWVKNVLKDTPAAAG
jgi:hypothetical protein